MMSGVISTLRWGVCMSLKLVLANLASLYFFYLPLRSSSSTPYW